MSPRVFHSALTYGGLTILLTSNAGFAITPEQKRAALKTETPEMAELSSKSARALTENLDRYLSQLVQSYDARKWNQFNETNLALLRYSRRIPIYHLHHYHERLLNRLAEDGIDPLLTWLVEYGRRTLEYSTTASRARYESLREAYKAAERKREWRDSTAPHLLRTESRSYRAYAQSAAVVVANFMMSDYGAKQVAARTPPTALLGLARVYVGCRESTASENKPGTYAGFLKARLGRSLDECAALSKELENIVGPAGTSDMESLASDLAMNNSWQATASCLAEENDTVGQMIEQLEGYSECKTSDARNVTDLVQSMATESTSSSPGGANESLGARWKLDPDGNWEQDPPGAKGQEQLGTGYSYTESVELDDGRNVDLYEHQTCRQCQAVAVEEDDGSTTTYRYTEQSGGGYSLNRVTTTYPEGTKRSDTQYDGSGNVEHHQEWNKQGGTTREDFANGDSYAAEWNDNGTLKKETIKEGDTTTTVEYDSNGNVKSTTTEKTETTATGTTTPVDDHIPDPCAAAMVGNFLERVKPQIERVQKAIMPNPEAPIEPSPDSCLTTAVPEDKRGKCKSIALCQLGYQLDSNCSCSNRVESMPDTQYESTCYQLMCAEGYSCDPSTGSCTSGSQEMQWPVPGWRLGSPPGPSPPVRIDGPHQGLAEAVQDGRWRSLQNGRAPSGMEQ